jgi:epsilon-lactone hydrolase
MEGILRQITNSPWACLLCVYTFVTQVALITARRLLLPHLFTYQSLRTQLFRAYLISTFALPALPIQASESEARLVEEKGKWKGYLIPGTRDLRDFTGNSSGGRRVIALYAHGGGYGWGEARQYLSYMRRWIECAKAAGIDLVFLSVEYPLSGEAPHPAQLHSFTAAYQYLLSLGIESSSIIFMGDSAGGGLSTLTAISLLHFNTPQPSACILISPWLDLSGQIYDHEGGNALIETDFVDANVLVPVLSAMFIGKNDPKHPSVNPLLNDPQQLQGLCPQLVLVGAGEFALQDSKTWTLLCEKAGVEVELVVERGQPHIYAMGSKWLESAVRKKTEDKIVQWMARGGGASGSGK